jgi:hypothetical protein
VVIAGMEHGDVRGTTEQRQDSPPPRATPGRPRQVSHADNIRRRGGAHGLIRDSYAARTSDEEELTYLLDGGPGSMEP